VHQGISTKERQRNIEAEILRAKRMRRWYLCVYIFGIALMIARFFAMDWYFHLKTMLALPVDFHHRLIFFGV
jgi:hypothetical protein